MAKRSTSWSQREADLSCFCSHNFRLSPPFLQIHVSGFWLVSGSQRLRLIAPNPDIWLHLDVTGLFWL